MSGDVQPRKRKDKRRRKDELSVEEPRGTAAVFGEGDVFMHSQNEHGTGGHWCAKVIFFSLLTILVTLIGLIILENRGLSELEANAVESRYSGVLEGWIEDTPDDDHHDEHTLELKHHDEEDDEHDDITDEEHDDNDNKEDNEQTDDADEDDDETDEGGDDIDEEDEDETHYDDEDYGSDEENDSQDDDDEKEDEDQDNEVDGDQKINSAENEEDEDESNFRKYYENVEEHDDDVDEDDDNEYGDNDDDDRDIKDDEIDEIDDEKNSDEQKDDEDEENDNSNDDDDDQANDESDSDQQLDNNDDEDQRDDESNEYEEPYARRQIEEVDEDDLEEDAGVEVEKIEKEVSDEDVLEEAAASNVEDEDKSADQSHEESAEENQIVDEEEFLEQEDIEEPVVVERITAPAGKPLPEVEEETSNEKPPDTLAEEEEYEKQQEELRRQKEQASHLWLKVAVGGALLVATHAVVRRATAPRDPALSAEHASREETPSAIDRRMTLIPEESSIVTDEPEEVPLPPPPTVKAVERVSTVTAKSVPPQWEKSEEEEDQELEFEAKNVEPTEFENNDEDKELYSDDDIEEEEEQEIEEQTEAPIQKLPENLEKNKEPKRVVETIKPEVRPDEEVPEDVEIIDDEQLEEEVVEEEEEDEEDISDVDDAELLSRLEAKYGRLPEPERPMPKKDGGNSVEDEWPGEPSDQYWRQQLDEAERELLQGSWVSAEQHAGVVELRGSARARYVRARALDAAAEAHRDNRLLTQSIAAYLELLKMNEQLSDKKLLEITNRTLERIRFRGNYMNAEPIYRLLIRRFPDDPSLRNNLSIVFLMANRPDLAEAVLKETLRRWPDDRIALAHLGFILKTSHNKLEEAVDAIRKALDGDIGAANEPRFYFHLGDALLLLGRFEEAKEVHERGAKLGHFISPAQRSLYNVERLKSQPWWDVEQTPYKQLARALESSWQTILKEGEAARALYEQEKEGLKERGEWSQLDLFVRGQELPGRCKKAPITCSVVRQEIAAVGCKRGQIKFSAMEAGTHVRPHVGPTNCRLRMHLGLSNTKDTYIRVDKEIRQWQVGKVLMFDDSFEHEVWHNGTGTRLVLIVDVWHPDLTTAHRRQLPAI